MIAIHTKYIGPTNTRGARVKAYTAGFMDQKGFSVTIPYPYGLSGERCHFQAVVALVDKHKLDWPVSEMCYGDSADGRGFVFCFPTSRVTP